MPDLEQALALRELRIYRRVHLRCVGLILWTLTLVTYALCRAAEHL